MAESPLTGARENLKERLSAPVLTWVSFLFVVAFSVTYVGLARRGSFLTELGLGFIALLTALIAYFG